MSDGQLKIVIQVNFVVPPDIILFVVRILKNADKLLVSPATQTESISTRGREINI